MSGIRHALFCSEAYSHLADRDSSLLNIAQSISPETGEILCGCRKGRPVITPKLANSIIDSLPEPERSSFLERLEPVFLPVGTSLSLPGKTPQFAHFMTSGLASVVTFMENGSGAEVGLVGSEGLVEAIHLLGPGLAPTTAFIQSDATALRMPFADLQQRFLRTDRLSHRILECVQGQGFVLSQLAACHGLHEIEERLARWLLMVEDKLGTDRFDLTQEFLAEMLGARRTSVTLAAGTLQRSGLISYSRGRIQIVDREGLQSAACECYPIVRDLVTRLYPA
jgi:CRP-like cAMP-binding protein